MEKRILADVFLSSCSAAETTRRTVGASRSRRFLKTQSAAPMARISFILSPSPSKAPVTRMNGTSGCSRFASARANVPVYWGRS